MSEVIRQPIQSPLNVEMIPAELELQDFIPKHRFQFSNVSVSEEASEMYNSLKDFLEVNQELILSQKITDPEEYAKGFKQAIALCELWIDSIYLEKEEGSD